MTLESSVISETIRERNQIIEPLCCPIQARPLKLCAYRFDDQHAFATIYEILLT